MATSAASRLIDAWIAHHGKPIPWAKAVEILVVTDNLSDSERQRLLALDETPPPQMSLPLIPESPTPEPVDDGIFGPPPMDPITTEEQQMLDAIAAETDLRAFPAIVTSTYTDWSTTPRTTQIRDNDGRLLTRIQRATLRRIWALQGR
jgi:hypothetical protein